MTDPTPSVSGTDEALVWLAFRAESAGAHPNYAIVSDYLIGMAQQNAALQRELAEAREDRDSHQRVAIAAESPLADARRDAERYRWLRDIDADGWPAVRVPCPCPDGIPYPRCTVKHTTPKRGEALDAAIDAAIGATHEG